METVYAIAQYSLACVTVITGMAAIFGEMKRDVPGGGRKLTRVGKATLLLFIASAGLSIAAERAKSAIEDQKEKSRIAGELSRQKEVLNEVKRTNYPIEQFDVEAYILVRYEDRLRLSESDRNLTDKFLKQDEGLTALRVTINMGTMQVGDGPLEGAYELRVPSVAEARQNGSVTVKSLWDLPGDHEGKDWQIAMRAPAELVLDRTKYPNLEDLGGMAIRIGLSRDAGSREIRGEYRLSQVRIVDRRTGIRFTTDKLRPIPDGQFGGNIPKLDEWE